MVFLHGSGGYGGMWRYQTDYFPDSEAITLPGHPEGERCKSVEEYADWLRQYIIAKRYKDVVLAGHSLGGAIAMVYALKYPQDLKGLILIGTGAKLRVHPMYLGVLEEAIKGNTTTWDKWMEESYRLIDPEFKKELMEKRKVIGPKVQLDDLLCCDKFDIMDKVQGIRLPTLIICGEMDILTPVKYADYLGRKIAGSKVVLIPGATHFVFMEKPSEVNKAIDEFLREIP